MADRFQAVGTIEAGESITVVSEIDALAMELPFGEGQPIAKGALIARLDDAQLKAQEARAEAILAQSQISYDRIKTLVGTGAAPQQDLDNAAAQLKVASADVDLAKASLAKTRIVAPFSGIVGARLVSPGAFLRAGTPITDLSQIDELRVTFSAPERFLGRIRRGAEVGVSTIAYPGHEVVGRTDVIDPQLDPVTRSAKIMARVRNPEGRFRPGMSANVVVVLAQRDSALTIPNEAVFAEGSQSYVFVVKPDSTVTRSPVWLGTRGSDVVEVTKGLEPGMQVVRAGHQKLYEGAKVMPVPGQPAQAQMQGAGE